MTVLHCQRQWCPSLTVFLLAVVFNPNRSGASEHVRKGVEKAVEILSKTGFGVEEALPPRLDDAVKIWKEVCVYELLNGLRPASFSFS